jgi:acyl-homoserine lactone acylase PvdQ
MIRRLAGSSLAVALLTALTLLSTLSSGSLREVASSDTVEVTIYRDEYGVPHIYGDTAEATAYGFGYAQAQDHLDAMRKDFYQAMGRRAEFFGPSYVSSDVLSRLLTETAAAPTAPQLRPPHRIDARGDINLYIEENAGSPGWMLPVQPQEVLAWFHYGRIIEQWQIASAELGAGASAAPDRELSADEVGSNMWVVGPAKSSAGAPILHGDPHLPWTGGMQWYEAHLSYPVNVGGASFFGYPASP